MDTPPKEISLSLKLLPPEKNFGRQKIHMECCLLFSENIQKKSICCLSD